MVTRHPDPPHPPHTPAGADPSHGSVGGRLNLLLSHADWHHDQWADRLEPLLAPMGIQAHRAPDARTATRILDSTPVHLAIVDLSVPLEGSTPLAEAGWKILELLSSRAATDAARRGAVGGGAAGRGALGRVGGAPTLVIRRRRSTREQIQEMNAALRLGAFAVLDRPKEPSDFELLLEVLRRALTRHYQGRWPQS